MRFAEGERGEGSRETRWSIIRGFLVLACVLQKHQSGLLRRAHGQVLHELEPSGVVITRSFDRYRGVADNATQIRARSIEGIVIEGDHGVGPSGGLHLGAAFLRVRTLRPLTVERLLSVCLMIAVWHMRGSRHGDSDDSAHLSRENARITLCR